MKLRNDKDVAEFFILFFKVESVKKIMDFELLVKFGVKI